MKRPCDCAHRFPLCCCKEGYSWADTLIRSRLASALAGWPGELVPDLVAEHESRMAAMDSPASEVDLLAIVSVCPHARIAPCACMGIDCVGGTHDGQRVTIDACRDCLATSGTIT